MKSIDNNRNATEDKVTYSINIDVYISNPFIIKENSDSERIELFNNADGSLNYKALGEWELFIQRAALKLCYIFSNVDLDNRLSENNSISLNYWLNGSKKRDDSGSDNTDVLLKIRALNNCSTYEIKSEDVKNENPSIEVAKITVKCKELGIDNAYATYNDTIHAMYKSSLIFNGTYCRDK